MRADSYFNRLRRDSARGLPGSWESACSSERDIPAQKTGARKRTRYNSVSRTVRSGVLSETVMSYDSKFSDPKQVWQRVLERLYHEDHILYARMNNFSTVQAFLATALAFTTSATTIARNISLIVSLFGLALSLFYISLGLRGVRVIQFWRAYLRLLESIPGVTSIDSHLFEFYRLGHLRGPKEAHNRPPSCVPSRSSLVSGYRP